MKRTINCITVDDEALSRRILKDFIAQTSSLKLIEECRNAVDAFSALQNHEIDLMFLDIKMPGMSGIDIIKNIKNLPLTVLITANKEFAVEAFEHDVVDFIVKPLDFSRFIKSVDRAVGIHEQINSADNSFRKDSFFVKTDGKLINLHLGDILWIEAMENYIIINTTENKHMVLMTMKFIEYKLPSSDFLRVHRSFIVAKDKIEAIIADEIQIKDKKIPIGNTYKELVHNNINLI